MPLILQHFAFVCSRRFVLTCWRKTPHVSTRRPEWVAPPRFCVILLLARASVTVMDRRKMKPQEISSDVLTDVCCEIEWAVQQGGDIMHIKKMKLWVRHPVYGAARVAQIFVLIKVNSRDLFIWRWESVRKIVYVVVVKWSRNLIWSTTCGWVIKTNTFSTVSCDFLGFPKLGRLTWSVVIDRGWPEILGYSGGNYFSKAENCFRVCERERLRNPEKNKKSSRFIWM